ncbi:MAG: NADPH dehydrogenase NamA [Erysipelotrichaceae bacterium]|nr:NADPH dehydrogenase NamA [Erysipelotrichaceae bacterium]MDD3809432.1 NADPH dehydrogenase NamA [Erysipelotrichaceae bacterium]
MSQPKLFDPYQLKNLELKNRLVMPPMCMYSANEDGIVTDFHRTHYCTRAIGGVGLIIVEATGIAPNGRISDGDLGLWDDSQIAGLQDLVAQIKSYDTHVGIQLNHGGRKYDGKLQAVAPSAIAFDDNYGIPNELTSVQIKEIVASFQKAAIRADKAGFDMIEIHGAHGYLINQFLSPHSNKRIDEYGGTLENRIRFLKEVIAAIRAVWPSSKTLGIRISAVEYLEDGYPLDEMVGILKQIRDDIDVIHVSTGGNGAASYHVYPGYQLKPAEVIKKEVGLPTIAVGLLDDIKLVEEVLNNDRADLVAIGRGLLANPYFAMQEGAKARISDMVPFQYARAFRK